MRWGTQSFISSGHAAGSSLRVDGLKRSSGVPSAGSGEGRQELPDEARKTGARLPAVVARRKSPRELLIAVALLAERTVGLKQQVRARDLAVEVLRELGRAGGERGAALGALGVADSSQPAVLKHREQGAGNPNNASATTVSGGRNRLHMKPSLAPPMWLKACATALFLQVLLVLNKLLACR